MLRGDHPRSRGVYALGELRDEADHGSSPLARGLRVWKSRPKNSEGIIPARAGFTCYSRMHITTLWDHPRSRGVYLRYLFLTL